LQAFLFSKIDIKRKMRYNKINNGGAFMCEKVIQSVSENKIIVIVRGVEKEKLIPLAEAMYEGGIRLLEITYDATGKISDEQTASMIKMLSDHFDGRMYIGAGTVLKKEQVRLTKESGGKFIISPDTNGEIIKYTKEQGLVSMPGALTPTEIQAAHTAGADFVKLFPVSNMGILYVKAVSAPLSHIKLLAVGGVDKNNMADYLKAGAVGFGLGSNIVDKKLIAENNFEAITELAKECVGAIN
jgi:2-dehydro-3-deoxyphosphogluconate aldolase/(4S)-4-hydroxy-2-oxoglutarate aldolase